MTTKETVRTHEEATSLADYIEHMIRQEPDVGDVRIYQEHQSEGDDKKFIFLKVIIPYKD